MAKTLSKPKTGAKAKTGKAALKLDTEEDVQSSDESVEVHPNNRKMAAKSTKSTTTKQSTAKSLPKDSSDKPKELDPTTNDKDQVEVVKIISPKYPARPVEASKLEKLKYYKQRAHHYQRKYEGATSDTGVCSEVSFSSSEEERGMIYHYEVKDSNGVIHNKANLDNRGKIAYHKVRDKTLLDYAKNAESKGCTRLPKASAVTLYPRLSAFLDDEGMDALCQSMPERLRNELAADLLLTE